MQDFYKMSFLMMVNNIISGSSYTTIQDIWRLFISSMIKLILFSLLIVFGVAQYNPTLSKDLCELTVASYCRPTKLVDWSCIPCKNSNLEISNVSLFINSTQATLGYIALSKKLDAIVIVFRGTEPWLIKNWISDINFIAIPYPLCDGKCKVHEGFYYAFSDIKSQIFDKITSYQKLYGEKNIVVVGHSLGAAIATHCVAHLIKAGFKVSLFENYGSPRVGDKNFSNWFQQLYPNVLKPRVTHRKDPVPHLPPKEWGFEHIQTEIFYEGDLRKGYKICNDASGEDKTCSNSYLADLDVLDHLTYYDIDFTANVLGCQ